MGMSGEAVKGPLVRGIRKVFHFLCARIDTRCLACHFRGFPVAGLTLYSKGGNPMPVQVP